MKVLSKVLLITLLAAIFGLAGCNQKKLPEVKSSAIPLPTIKSSTTDKSVTVLFPQKANVGLVEGVSKIGWIKINLQAKQIEVSLNSDTEKIDFARIKKVDFDLNRAILSDGDVAIKGEESSDLIEDTLTKIPVNDLKLSDSETGEVTVKLNNSALVRQEVLNSVVLDGIYVVEEILFDDSSSKMTLKVLCCMP
ncbi:MAG: hypothetical protein AAF915_21250 [Cyanobacteria bacterium P01_D01_bin.50]